MVELRVSFRYADLYTTSATFKVQASLIVAGLAFVTRLFNQ